MRARGALLAVGLLGLAALLAIPTVGVSAATAAPPVRAAASSGGAGGSDWATYLHDPVRSSAAAGDTGLNSSDARHLVSLWNVSTRGVVAAEPAVVNGTVFEGSWDGKEYALNATTGAQIWARNLSTSFDRKCGTIWRGITSSATVEDGVLYVGAGSGWWYALNASTGRTLWRIFLGNTSEYYNWGSPLIVHGYAYIGIASECDMPLIRGALWMVSLTTHKAVHRFYTVSERQVGGSIWGSPTYDPVTNSILVATGNGRSNIQQLAESILALNASTLKLESYWHLPRSQVGGDSDFGTTVALFTTPTGRALAGAVNKNGVYYALDRSNLSAGPVWSFRVALGGSCPECGQGSIVPAAVNGTMLYVGGGATNISGVAYNGSVAALYDGNGTPAWQVGLPGLVLAAPTYVNGLLLVGAGNRLYLLDAANGSVVWSRSLGGTLYGGTAVVGSCLYVGDTNGRIDAFAPKGLGCGALGTPAAPIRGLSAAGSSGPGPALLPGSRRTRGT